RRRDERFGFFEIIFAHDGLLDLGKVSVSQAKLLQNKRTQSVTIIGYFFFERILGGGFGRRDRTPDAGGNVHIGEAASSQGSAFLDIGHDVLVVFGWKKQRETTISDAPDFGEHSGTHRADIDRNVAG